MAVQNPNNVPDQPSSAAALLTGDRQVGAGIHDGISAVLAQSAAFDFFWIGSFSMSAALGLPDVGLLDVSDVKAVVSAARRVSATPIVVDMETGYGDAVRTFYAASALAAAGATAVCIEDNGASRRCSLYDGYERTLVEPDEHCAKIAAARAAVRPFEGAVVARSEALVAGLGVNEALRRCHAYVEAGADAVFVQCVARDGLDDLLTFCRRWERRAPVFIAPTRYEQVARPVFYEAGATHYIYANQALRAAHRAVARTYREMMTSGIVSTVEERLSSVSEVAADVGEEGVRQADLRFPRPAPQPAPLPVAVGDERKA